MWSPDKCPHSTSSSTTFIKWIYREPIWKGPLPVPKKYPHEEKNNGFFLMRYLKLNRNEVFPKKNQLAKFSRPKLRKKVVVVFLEGNPLNKKAALNQPKDFSHFFWWSKQASQSATILDAFQVCFQTRSAWHWSLPPFKRDFRFRIGGVMYLIPRHTRHQPRNVSFLCIGW